MQDVVTDGETEAQRLEASGLTHGRAESRGQSSDNNVGLSLLPPLVLRPPQTAQRGRPDPICTFRGVRR